MTRRRFIIIGLQRSGTSVTQTVLGGHPNVCMLGGEVLAAPFYSSGVGAFTGGRESFANRRRTFPAIFDAMTASAATEETLAHGLKTALQTYGEAWDFATCLREYLPDIKLILVVRNDLVAQHGSSIRAHESNFWHAWEGATDTERPPLTIDVDRFRAHAIQCKRAMFELRSLATTHEVLEFDYERDIEPGVRHDRLFAFLGLPDVPITWQKMSKLNPPPESYIANYAELRAVLDALPEVTAADVRGDAERRRLEQARREPQSFLIYRAFDLLQEDRSADGLADLEVALEKIEGIDNPSVAGGVHALLEAAADEPGGPPAAGALRTLHGVFGENPYFLVRRGCLRAEHGRHEGAVQDLLGALHRSRVLGRPEQEVAFLYLEELLRRLGDKELAERSIASLEQDFAGDPAFLFLRGKALCETGRQEEGLATLRRVVDLDPAHRRARDLLRYLAGE